MATTFHLENYLAIRKTYPRWTGRTVSRLTVADPGNAEELDYRDLLSEANENFFHREYAIALQNYLALRYKIMAQSHPELPAVAGGSSVVSIALSRIDPKRLIEMSRLYYEITDPGGPIELTLSDRPVISAGKFPVNPAMRRFSGLGLDAKITPVRDLNSQRGAARRMVLDGQLDRAREAYDQVVKEAMQLRNYALAADLIAESAVMMSTYAKGQARRPALTAAAKAFDRAERLYRDVDNQAAQSVIKANLANVYAELGNQRSFARTVAALDDEAYVELESATRVNLKHAVESGDSHAFAAQGTKATELLSARLPKPQTARTFLLSDNGNWTSPMALLAKCMMPTSTERQVGLMTQAGVKALTISEAKFASEVIAQIYEPRITAATLEALGFYEDVETNFVAYIPHLYFFTLPVAIGDTYLALGRYQAALNEYLSVLVYPYLNRGIETSFLWMRIAKVYLRWGDELFRQDAPALARTQYEHIIKTDLGVPTASPLYASAAMAPMRTEVGEVAKELKDQPHAAVNPKVAELVMQAYIQLQKIKQGLNFLGLAADYYPVLRFKYLQGVANYMADNAVQAERTFINFRAQAENQKLERIQLENAVEVNKTAVTIEATRFFDAILETGAAHQSREYAELRRDHAQAALDDWNTLGRELASVNEALSWASNAANDQDITYTGVRYNGQRHDFDTDVEEFYDVVGEWRENLNFDIQQRRLARQRLELDSEVALAQLREAQANVRRFIQSLSVGVASKRLEGAQEMLNYARDRMFDDDLWFRLAGELQDLSRQYLDMAIFAAFLMERAYDLEFDRRLNRIRLDYGIGGVEGLLGGDYLKRDVASFTIDYVEHAQKKNPMRLAISLRDEFPAAFDAFTREGILPFRTDLEIFDRRYPGTYRRKLKMIEVFIEGLVPLDGAHGSLLHQGLSTEWRLIDGNWIKHTRVMPPERMALSSYEYRRDLTVFQPSEEMLGLFENMGPQGNWTLELPRSANNLDYQAISDIKFVVYFDADYSDALAAHVKGFYPNDGGRELILSSRFHFPDQYFRLDADRQVTYQLHPARFAYNYTNLRLAGFGVRLLSKTGTLLANQPITVTRASDNSSVNGVTNAQGVLQGDAITMAPFAAWKNTSPVDSFTVGLGADVDPTTIGDLQLFIDYVFDYRADGTLPA